MFSLTKQEQMLIACVLLSIVCGSLIKHFRRVYRAEHPAPAATATPARKAKDFYLQP